MSQDPNTERDGGCSPTACSPLDFERVDFRGDEDNAPIIHPGKSGTPVRLIVGRNDDLVRQGVVAWLDLMGESEPPPSQK